MSTPAEKDHAFPQAGGDSTPAAPSPMRLFYWNVRRELWENRSIYMAPLVVGAFAVVGFCFSMIGMPGRRRAALLLDEAARRAAIQQPYDMVAMMLLATGFLVGAFYCLDALYGERKDRSILFWKSLPVSDLTTVLSKLAIPVLVLPAITFAVTSVAQLLMFILSSFVLLANGISPATTVANLQAPLHAIVLPYGLTILALWHVPIYAWLLLVSAWAKRATLLWAVLPFVAISVLERIAFNTTVVSSALHYRLGGGVARAFRFKAPGVVDSLAALTPLRFLSTPGLWIGLALAAALIAAAVRLRRNREPI